MATTFAYSVRDRSGKMIQGTLEADNQAAVAQRAEARWGTPRISISEANAGTEEGDQAPRGSAKKVKLKDLAVFSRQFATMINSGLSLLRALNILTEQTENNELARVLGEVRNDIETGNSLSASMGKAPERVPAAHGQHAQGRRGRRLPRLGDAADRRELRVRGRVARQGQGRDDLPGRGLLHRDPRRGRHAAVRRAGVRQPVQDARAASCRRPPSSSSSSPGSCGCSCRWSSSG